MTSKGFQTFFIATFLIIASVGVKAVTIEKKDLAVSGDESILYVKETGLYWLTIDLTLATSYQDVANDLTLSNVLGLGWRIATIHDVNTLFTVYGFTPDTCNNGATHCSNDGEDLSVAQAMTADFKTAGGPLSAVFSNEFLASDQAGRAYADTGGSSVDADTSFTQNISVSNSAIGVLMVRTPIGEDIEVRDLFLPGDGRITYVDQTGLEWLDLSLTLNKTYQEVESDPTLAGLLGSEWRIATIDEVNTLFTAYGFTPDNCNNGATHCAPAGESELAAQAIISNFNSGINTLSAVFSNSNLASGNVGRAYADFGGDTVDGLTDATSAPTDRADFTGVFLVRVSPALNENIPLPAFVIPIGAMFLVIIAVYSRRVRPVLV